MPPYRHLKESDPSNTVHLKRTPAGQADSRLNLESMHRTGQLCCDVTRYDCGCITWNTHRCVPLICNALSLIVLKAELQLSEKRDAKPARRWEIKRSWAWGREIGSFLCIFVHFGVLSFPFAIAGAPHSGHLMAEAQLHICRFSLFREPYRRHIRQLEPTQPNAWSS